MKKFRLAIAAFLVVASAPIASAQSVVIERGGHGQQGYGSHQQGHSARAQIHGNRHGDRAYSRRHGAHGDNVVIIKKKRYHHDH